MRSANLKNTCALSAAILLALGLDTAYADCASSPPPSGWSCSDNNNFTMLDPGGGTVAGSTNDVTFAWDGTYKTSVVTDGTNNATISSPTAFFGVQWTAHHVNVYGPGTYVFKTLCSAAGNPSCSEWPSGIREYTLVVPSGYVGAHMLFDWSGNNNIDVVQLWKTSDSWADTTVSTDPSLDMFSLGTPNSNGNTAATDWSFVSIDTPSSTFTPFSVAGAGGTTILVTEETLFHGTSMIDGPFQGFAANFSVNITTAAAGDAVSNTVSMDADNPKMPGCSITSAPVSATDRIDWWLIAGFLAWLGAWRLRFKRQTQS